MFREQIPEPVLGEHISFPHPCAASGHTSTPTFEMVCVCVYVYLYVCLCNKCLIDFNIY